MLEGRMTARRLTAKRVRELLDCDSSTGILTWRPRSGNPAWNTRWAGKQAGSLDRSTGYLRLDIDGRHYYAHRIVFLHVKGWLPKQDLDHKDGNRQNCAIGNLRPASVSQNGANTKSGRQRKRPGPRGCWQEPSGRWQVTTNANGKKVWIGRFATEEAAARAYRDATDALHGEFAVAERPAPMGAAA
jgi:hypothetical protein